MRLLREPPSAFFAPLLAVFYLAVAAVALGANPFGGQTITPFDLLISQPGWAAVEPGTVPRDGERSDVVDVRLPQWLDARNQLLSGHLPTWDDRAAGGDVGFFNLTNGMFTPAFWLFVLSSSPPDGFYLGILFNLAVAGLGMHLLLRRKLRLVAALVGGVSFQLCGFHAAWLYWPHVLTFMWAPWLLLAIDQCLRRPAFGSAIAVGLATAMVVLGGFPFVGMLVLGAGSLYALICIVANRAEGPGARGGLVAYVMGTMLGFLLCALPLHGFVQWISRFPLGYRHGGTLLGPHDWHLLLAPWAYGTERVEATMYVGSVMAALALVGLVANLARPRRIELLPAFGIGLFVIAAGLVFGYWPMWLMSRLPGFNSNIWTRAISILDLSIVVLGAWTIDWLWRMRPSGVVTRRVLHGAVLLVAAAQVVDLGNFFRDYNGPVSGKFFYPRTPELQYMASRAGPFDYVLADKSYLISGTLGAYGLHEWFAHSFRSEPLKHALTRMASNPFSSPTSSRLGGEQIMFSSPAMAEFNVCYIAVGSKTDPYAVRPLRAAGGKRPLPPLPVARNWTQGFSLHSSRRLLGISIRMATYREHAIGGVLHLRLLDLDGSVVAEAQLRASSVQDNSLADFYFDKPILLAAGNYRFRVNFDPGRDGRKLTAWAYPAVGDPLLSANGKTLGVTLDYALHLEPPENPPFVAAFRGVNVTVYENRRCPKGPYVISSLGDVPDGASGRNVSVRSYRPGKFELAYKGNRAGYLVIPMSITDDWKTTVNGREEPYRLKDGVMPAIAVNGPTDVVFEYKASELPLFWLWLSCVGLMLSGIYWSVRRISGNR